MSYLGDVVRLDPADLQRIRTGPDDMYKVLCEMEHPEKLELDQAWQRLGMLLDAA